jgi:hypothetical protein
MPCRHLLAILLLSLSLPIAGASDGIDYQLTDIDGRVHKVSDYRGKWQCNHN